MVTLAEKFAALNKAPPKPSNVAEPKGDNITSSRNQNPFHSTPKKAAASMQSPRQHRSTPVKKTAPRTEEETILDEKVHPDDIGLGVPTSFGVHKKFNYTTRQSTTFVLVRVILNNAVTLQDIEFEWVTPRRMKLRVAWPEWFQMAEQMAQFTLDSEGSMVFPP